MRTGYQTPLHLAATVGDIEIAKLLLEKRARIDALDIDQETPLYKCAANNHPDFIDFLLDQ